MQKVIGIIIFLVLQCSTKTSMIFLSDSSPKCPMDVCTCTKGIVRCRDHGLNYIPLLPRDTTELDFSQNHLNALNNATFRNISRLKIRSISLSYCNITHISADAFLNLRTISTLDLSGNMIDFNSSVLNVGLRGLNKSKIKSLNLSAQELSNPFLRVDAFDGLADTALERLLLRDCHLEKIDGKVVSKLKSLTIFDASNNDITEAHLDGFDTLHELDISSNDIFEITVPSSLTNLTWLNVSDNYLKTVRLGELNALKGLDLSKNEMFEVPSFCNSFNFSNVPSLRYLNMSNNHISDLGYHEENITCLPSLRKLQISYNPIGIIRTKQFSSMKNLKSLDLIPMLVTRLLIERHAFSSTSLNHLAVGVFQQFIVKEQIHMFENCSSLKKLVLSGFKLKRLSDQDLSQMFSPILNITSLSLIQADLQYIPSIISHMRAIGFLRLYNNYISHWGKETFRRLNKLKTLDLTSNAISVVNKTSFPYGILQRMKKIDLWYNPFSCTCENYWFINWVNANKKKLSYDILSHKYKCNSPLKLTYRPLTWYNPTYLECHGLESYQTAIILAGSFLLIFMIVVIFYRKYKWHLRYYIYLLRSKKEKDNIIPTEEFKYDAFVAYTSDDRSWVISNLMAVLEGQHNFCLCLHERDFLPGLTILDQISETIKHSKKVILVLSNNFAKSQWCQYEILLAQHRFLEEGGNSLILILLDEIKGKYMTNCLRMLLRTMTYISWTDNSEGRKLFWRKLIVSMKN